MVIRLGLSYKPFLSVLLLGTVMGKSQGILWFHNFQFRDYCSNLYVYNSSVSIIYSIMKWSDHRANFLWNCDGTQRL